METIILSLSEINENIKKEQLEKEKLIEELEIQKSLNKEKMKK